MCDKPVEESINDVEKIYAYSVGELVCIKNVLTLKASNLIDIFVNKNNGEALCNLTIKYKDESEIECVKTCGIFGISFDIISEYQFQIAQAWTKGLEYSKQEETIEKTN